jgi:hypothetical protein
VGYDYMEEFSGLDDVEKWKFLTLPVIDPLVFQPVASRYND